MSCYKKNNPGDPCCVEEPCLVTDDDFDTGSVTDGRTVSSGTWSIGSSQVSTSSANALLIMDTPLGGTGPRAQTIEFTVTLRPSSQAFGALAITDANDYLYGRLQMNAGGTAIHFVLIERTGGVNGAVATANNIITYGSAQTSATLRVRVCFTNGGLTGEIFGVSTLVTGAVGSPHNGLKCGVGAASSGAQIDFGLITHQVLGTNDSWGTNAGDEVAGCMKCRQVCNQCDAAYPPLPSMTLDFDATLTNDLCNGCTSIGGEYVLGASSSCCWRYIGPHLCPTANSCPDSPAWIRLDLCVSYSGGTATWTCTLTLNITACIDPISPPTATYVGTVSSAGADRCQAPPATLTRTAMVGWGSQNACDGEPPTSMSLSI